VDAEVDGAWYHSGMAELAPVDGDQGGPEAPRYELILGGRLDPSWSDWFDGLQLQPTPDGHTLLMGAVPDQAALHGLLARIRDLGIDLLGLRRQDQA
jgi:hypothetical protein